MIKLHCLLVDDEPPALEILRNYISNIPMLEVVHECHHAIAAFEFLQENPVDILFLDVNMPKLSGTDLLRSLSNPPKVIFTTAYRDFAVEGFELGAVDYLLKPYSLERLLKAVQRVAMIDIKQNSTSEKNSDKTSERFIYVRADRKMVKILTHEILYVESMKDYVRIFLPGRCVITKQTMNSIEEMLSDEFVRIHRSFIVALKKIESYDQHAVYLAKAELPIGPLYRAVFLERIRD